MVAIYASSSATHHRCLLNTDFLPKKSMLPNEPTLNPPPGDASQAHPERWQWGDRFFLSFLAETPESIIILDDNGQILAVNDAACHLFRWASSNLVGQCISEILISDAGQLWQSIQGTPAKGIVQIQTGNKRERTVEYSITTMSPSPDRHLLILRDITQYHAIEQSFQESTTQLTHLLKNSRACITRFRLIEKKRIYDYYSPGCETVFGYSPEQLMAHPNLWRSRVLSEDFETVIQPAMKALLRGKSSENYQFRFHHPDGSIRWIQETSTAYPDHATNGWIVTTIAIDVTHSKRAELDLTRQTQRTQMFMHVVTAIHSSLNLNQIFTLTVERIVQHLQAGATIAQYQSTEQSWRSLVTSHPTDQPNEITVFPAIHSDAIRTFTTQLHQFNIVEIDDLTRLKYADNSSSATQTPMSPQAWLLVPIVVEEQVWGCLSLQSDQKDRWDVEEIHLAQQIVYQLAIAIQQAELYQQLHNAHERDALVLQSIGEGIWDWHIEQDIQYVSDQYWRILGYDPETQGQGVNSFQTELARVHPDDQESVFVLVQTHLTFRTPFRVEIRMQHQDGHYIWIRIKGQAVWDEQGKPVRMLGTIENISDRKVVEETLRQRECEFRTLVENSPDGIIRISRQFRFLYVNPIIEVRTGLSKADFLGKTIWGMDFPVSLVSQWQAAITEVFETGQERLLETQEPMLAGEHYFYSRIVPERGQDQQITSVLIISRDVTNLKQLQQSLLQQKNQEQTLRFITQRLRRTLNLNETLATAVTEVQTTLKADRTLIFRLNSDQSGVVVQEAVRPEYPVTLEMRWEDECFPTDCYAHYYQGKARIVPNVAFDDWGECLAEFLQQTGVQSKMVAPIVQPFEDGSQHLWGLLITHACAELRQWQPDELELLHQVANQLAIAIQQAELHQMLLEISKQQSNLYQKSQNWAATLQCQVNRQTEELQKALEFEATLRHITDRVRDSLDEEQILDTVVIELGQLLHLAYCHTSIHNEDQTLATITHEFAQDLTSIRGYNIDITDENYRGIYDRLFQGDTLQFCEIVPDSLLPGTFRLTILICPMRDNHQIFGNLWLVKSGTDLFTPQEVRLVEQVGNQCAIALRQARLFEASQAQVTELEKLDQLKNDFLSTISHEFRTPIASIKMATELLEIQLKHYNLLPPNFPDLEDDGSEEKIAESAVVRYFQILKTEGMREINLIDDLLELTRLDAQSDPLKLMTLYLQDWLPQILESFRLQTQKNQQTLLYHFPPDLPAITVDLPYLQRITTELLTNACKYTPPQETIRLTASNNHEFLKLVVANSGIEIDDDQCDRIFDLFYRIPNHDPWRFQGTGLGLALVKKLVQRLGGTIHAESHPRETHIVLQLPC